MRSEGAPLQGIPRTPAIPLVVLCRECGRPLLGVRVGKAHNTHTWSGKAGATSNNIIVTAATRTAEECRRCSGPQGVAEYCHGLRQDRGLRPAMLSWGLPASSAVANTRIEHN